MKIKVATKQNTYLWGVILLPLALVILLSSKLNGGHVFVFCFIE